MVRFDQHPGGREGGRGGGREGGREGGGEGGRGGGREGGREGGGEGGRGGGREGGGEGGREREENKAVGNEGVSLRLTSEVTDRDLRGLIIMSFFSLSLLSSDPSDSIVTAAIENCNNESENLCMVDCVHI